MACNSITALASARSAGRSAFDALAASLQALDELLDQVTFPGADVAAGELGAALDSTDAAVGHVMAALDRLDFARAVQALSTDQQSVVEQTVLDELARVDDVAVADVEQIAANLRRIASAQEGRYRSELSEEQALAIVRFMQRSRPRPAAGDEVAAIARGILERHDPLGGALRDNAFVTRMLVEAYRLGAEARS